MELKKQKTYKTVYEIARDTLVASDYARRCAQAGLKCVQETGDTTIEVPYFDEIISIHLPRFSFESPKNANVTLVAKIILLHYINNASGIPLSGEKVAYGDIPSCMHYEPVFAKRVLKPLQNAFGYDKYAFLEAGLALGAKEEEYGDASFILFAFPKVPITFILWEGDEEFPPSVKALFDPSITGYLPLEDIVVIAKLAASRILKTAHKQHKDEMGDDT
jgi:hypothetical protein